MWSGLISVLTWPFRAKPHKYQNTMERNRGGPRKSQPTTDLTRWRLTCVAGRQTWKYTGDSDPDWRPQTVLEKHVLGLDTTSELPAGPTNTTAEQAALQAAEFLLQLQVEDGHWAGDYGGPLFLTPGLVIVCHVTGVEWNDAQRAEMIRYLRSVQCPGGGWGLHTEGPPTVFGCAMNYVAMRLLGVCQDDPDLVTVRNRLHALGGAIGIPSWGKFWLAVINLHSWDGIHNLCPELWLFPEWLPVHPSRMWCHCRQVYLAMAYCYSCRIQAPLSPLIQEIRQEIYLEDYDNIRWSSERNNIAASDLYTPHTTLYNTLMYFLDIYEKFHWTKLRDKATEKIYSHICADDNFTNYISIGPISKTIQMLVQWHHEGRESIRFRNHVERIPDYLWMGVDGMKMTGTNGSQLWDTALATRALLETGIEETSRFHGNLEAVHNWLLETQIEADPPDYHTYYRHMSRGGFPFSTRECGWIVSDCTAEGLKAVMCLEQSCDHLTTTMSRDKHFQAADILLSYFNDDGGVASYELTRGGVLLELLNPAEIFGDIMIDYTYVECTSAVLQALKHFSLIYDKYRMWEIQSNLNKAISYIEKQQRPDGSWYGSWGVCFTYGTWFALEAYGAMAYTYYYNNVPPAVEWGCAWLERHQLVDGGWGENFESCEMKEYVAAESSQVVNTAWALLGLMAVRYPNLEVLERGIRLLMDRQLPNGDFPQENIAGVFNKSCAIHYENYRNIFPMQALGRFAKLYPDSKLALYE